MSIQDTEKMKIMDAEIVSLKEIVYTLMRKVEDIEKNQLPPPEKNGFFGKRGREPAKEI